VGVIKSSDTLFDRLVKSNGDLLTEINDRLRSRKTGERYPHAMDGLEAFRVHRLRPEADLDMSDKRGQVFST